MSLPLPIEPCTPNYWYAGAVVLVIMTTLAVYTIRGERTQRRQLEANVQRARLQGSSVEIDPIAEAQALLAYGQETKALRVLEDAIRKGAGRPEVVEFLNDVKAGRVRSEPERGGRRALRTVGWLWICLAALVVAGGIFLPELGVPGENELAEYQGTLAAPVAFHQPPRGDLSAQLYLTVGTRSGGFNVAKVSLMPSKVVEELRAIPVNAGISVRAIPQACFDEDGLDVWVLSAQGRDIISFTTRELAERKSARQGLRLGALLAGVGGLFLGIDYVWAILLARRTRKSLTAKSGAGERRNSARGRH